MGSRSCLVVLPVRVVAGNVADDVDRGAELSLKIADEELALGILRRFRGK